MAKAIRRSEETVAHDEWHRWMLAYVAMRTDGLPRPLTTGEVGVLAEWVVLLPNAEASAATALILRRPGSLHRHTALLREVEKQPATYADLLLHLMRGTEPDFELRFHLDSVRRRLQPLLTEEKFRPLEEEFLRLGCR